MLNIFLPQMTQLSCSLVDHVAVLSLNNAPVNALSKTLSDELTTALDIISETPEVRSVILTGEGKVFCAGADLKGRASVIKAEYRALCGEIRGLLTAESYILDLAKNLENDDD